MFFKAYSLASLYLKLTFLNSISPLNEISETSFCPSNILSFVSNTSLIRFAQTVALGSIIKIIVNIINAITTCTA